MRPATPDSSRRSLSICTSTRNASRTRPSSRLRLVRLTRKWLLLGAFGRSTSKRAGRSARCRGQDRREGARRALDEVIRRLRTIEASAPPSDGVVCFARLYREVTEGVAAELTQGGIADTGFVETLDVHFAGLFFAALDSYGQTGGTPSAWAPLFAQRSRRGIAPLQFALAGMNAHINRDLPVALVTTCRELEARPQGGLSRSTPTSSGWTHLLDHVESAGEELVSNRLAGLGRPARPPVAADRRRRWRCGTWAGRATLRGQTRKRSGRSATSRRWQRLPARPRPNGRARQSRAPHPGRHLAAQARPRTVAVVTARAGLRARAPCPARLR